MSNKQAQPSKKMHLAHVLGVMTNGDVITLDMTKLEIINIETGKPLFERKVKK